MTDPSHEIEKFLEEDTTVAGKSFRLYRDMAKYVLIAVIILAACWFLTKKLKAAGVTWEKFVNGVQAISPWHIGLALAVTAFNFLILTGYDLLAVRYLKKSIPVHKVMMGAIIGYAISNVFGWLIGGTALRYRLYSRWGFKLIDIVAFVSFLSVTFWTGMFLLAGLAFVLFSVELPEKFHYPYYEYAPPRVFGWVFLAGAMLYLASTALYRKSFRVGGNEYKLPPPSLSVLQLLISAADFALASYVLYVLLPAGTASYPTVLVAYMAGMVVTVTVHAPGGVGVLDLILLHMLDPNEKDPELTVTVFCAVVLFRVIFYLLPALVSGVLLLYLEFTEKGTPKLAQPETD